MPSADFLALNPDYQGMAANKYGNEKAVVDGYTFDSAAESRRYSELKLLVAAGAITGLEVHPTFELQPAFRAGGRAYRAIKYEADFAYFDQGRTVVEDVKGMATKEFRIKEKLLRYTHPTIDFRLIEVTG